MKAILAHILSNLRLTMRERSVFFFNYAFPLGFFFLFATLNKAKESNSIAAVLTSVLTIGLLGNGFFGGGLRAVMERENGILRRFKVAPPGALPILISSLVVGVLQYFPVVLLMTVLSVVQYGMTWPDNWLSFFVFVIIANFAMRSMGGIIASVANSMAESQIIIQCLYFPMMLLSGATVPVTFLPEWVQSLVQFIPATHMVSGLQGILLQHESLLQNWKPVSALLITTVACTLISLKIFRWEKGEKLPARAKAWVLAVLAPFFLIGAWDLHSKENLTKSKAIERELARSQTILIRDARVITGTGTVIEGGSVLIKQGKIVALYNGTAPVAKSLNAIEIEAAGKTLLPGLIDVHIHLGSPGGFYDDPKKYQDRTLPEKRLKAYLYSGITSVKSAGDWIDSVIPLRDKGRRGEALMPELYVVGPLFTAAGGHPAQMLQSMPESARAYGQSQFVRLPKTPDEARAMLRELKAKNVDAIKAVLESGSANNPMPRLDLNVLKAICTEAKLLGLPVTVHTSKAIDVRDAFEAGANGVEHGSPNEALPDELLRKMAASGFYYDPTMSVFEGVRMMLEKDFTRLDDSLLQQVVPMDLLKSTRRLVLDPKLTGRYQEFAPRMKEARENLKRVFDAGVTLVTGTDAGNPLIFHGPTVQEEVELWVAAGIPAHQAILAATRNAAQLLGQGNRIGTIEMGKDANLLLVDGNPLQDPKSLSRISLVMLKGERISRAALLKED
ncbi:amidohydrolase family protein [Bryobacter aggregatus]|uniref:amidohydrolase family protein n=1 Tax=Bryobacter aggregatus TaxID=360054 RepID=UPI0004E17068|nr:amidohydrolase family protein [Bryobacter aggregatus]